MSELEWLTNAIDGWEVAEYIFAALVAIACFGEFIADFTDWWLHGCFWTLFGNIEHRKEKIGKVSTLVLIMALVGELFCLVKSNRLSGRLVSLAMESAGNANREAELAKRESKLLREQASDRSLTLLQKERDSLSRFRKQKFEILTYASDAESRKLSDLVAGVLQSSGWIHLGTAPNSPDSTSPTIIGVRVEISKLAGNGIEVAASALSDIFVSERLSAIPLTRITFPQDINGRDPNVIRIWVGTKPPLP